VGPGRSALESARVRFCRRPALPSCGEKPHERRGLAKPTNVVGLPRLLGNLGNSAPTTRSAPGALGYRLLSRTCFKRCEGSARDCDHKRRGVLWQDSSGELLDHSFTCFTGHTPVCVHVAARRLSSRSAEGSGRNGFLRRSLPEPCCGRGPCGRHEGSGALPPTITHISFGALSPL